MSRSRLFLGVSKYLRVHTARGQVSVERDFPCRGPMLLPPMTNNDCESAFTYVRVDCRVVPWSATETVPFIASQIVSGRVNEWEYKSDRTMKNDC